MDFEKYFDKLYQDYDKYIVVPIILIVAALGALGYNYAVNGEVVSKGLDFTGGTEVQYAVNGSFSTVEVEGVFASEGRSDVEAVTQITGNQTTLVLNIPPPEMDRNEIETTLQENGYQGQILSLRSLGAAVGDEFFTQAIMAFGMAFMIMSLSIFVAFKDVTPSLAVIFAAAGDIVFAMAGMVVFGIPLTLGSLAALLMLIGYSVDTDIVLSTRVLRRNRGSVKERIWSSVKTGVTMSAGGIAGFTLLYIISTAIVGPSELSNIAAVMVIGLLADMPFTWFGNAIILKKYVNDELTLEAIR